MQRGEDEAALRAVWREIKSQGFAARGSDPELGGLGAAVLVAGELGQAACPAPFVPAFIANILGRQAPALAAALKAVGSAPLALVLGAFDGDAQAGRLTARGSVLDGRPRFVEDRQIAAHLLALPLPGQRSPGAMQMGGSIVQVQRILSSFASLWRVIRPWQAIRT